MNVWKHAPAAGLLGGLAYGAIETSIALLCGRGVSLGLALSMLAVTAGAGVVLGAIVWGIGTLAAGDLPKDHLREVPGVPREFLLAEALRPRVLLLCAVVDACWIAFALCGLLQGIWLHGSFAARIKILLALLATAAGATAGLTLVFRHLTRRRRFVVAPVLDLWLLAGFLAAGVHLNRAVLPDLLHPLSLGANLSLLAVTVAVRVLAGRRLHGQLEQAGIRVQMPRRGSVTVSGLVAIAIVLGAWASRRDVAPPLPPSGPAATAPTGSAASGEDGEGGASRGAQGLSRSKEAGGRAEPSHPRLNVVMIVLDTARADRFGYLGYPRATTPRIDALAAESVVYTRARSTSSWTLPAHGSLFTGLYPTRHGAHASPVAGVGVDRAAADGVHNEFLSWPLGEENVTLAEVLQTAGWRTAGIVANSGYLSRVFGMDQGFAYWDDRPGILMPSKDDLASLALLRLLAPRAAAHWLRPYRSAGETNRSVFRWLDQAAREPFFLFVNYMDVHAPLLPPAPFDRRFLPGGRPAPPGGGVAEGVGPIDDGARMRLDGLYDGALNYLDGEVGRLVDRLDAAGILDRTLLIVLSDHGEMLGEHELVGHFDGLHEEVLRVPLLVRFPRTERSGAVDTPVSLVEVMPMILEQLGLPLPAALDAPGAGGTTRHLLAEQYENASLAVRYGKRFRGIQRAVYDDPWKLLWRSQGGTVLRNLEEDPRELRDRAGDEPQRVTALESFLDGWASSVRPVAEIRLDGLNDESRERLRALGY